MVNKKWIAQCCISLTVLSFYVPNAFAQQSSTKTDNCLVEQTDLRKTFTDRNYWWPIPSSEIEAVPTFRQTDGW